jgi:serine/threonine protein kinase/membrane protein implicated in regulation of membrane protease activity
MRAKDVLGLLQIFLLLNGVLSASDFNQAFAASVVANIEQLIDIPWTRVLNMIFTPFNSRWEYIYTGDKYTTSSGRSGFVEYVDHNHTQEYFWALFKPFQMEEASSIDVIYAGFENGMFIGYGTPAPGKLYFELNENSTCYEDDGDEIKPCWRIYLGNSTDETTGKIAGPPTITGKYDPRGRPWYTKSLSTGSIWTDPYIFADYGVLGITAAIQLETDEGEIIGVGGADYQLGSLQTVLVEMVEGYDDLLIFIVDNSGNMMAASVPGASITDDLEQIVANESSVAVISAIANHIEKPRNAGGLGGWVAANGTVMTIDVDGEGLYWAQSTELTDAYGLHWHIVVSELVSCDQGFFSPPEYKETECKECPEGGFCPGGASLFYPKEGYWVDRSSYEYGDKIYECSWDTCIGFSAAKSRLVKGETNDDMSEELLGCWEELSFNSSVCNADDLMCDEGSAGPLCGTCKDTYTYNSATRKCIDCDGDQSVIPAIVVGSIALLLVLLVIGFVLKDSPLFGGAGLMETRHQAILLWNSILKIPPFSILKHVDQGMLKVIWGTSQIVGTISWNLSIRYPEPFDSLLKVLAYLQLDFFALDCQFQSANFMSRVLFNSIGPIVIAIIIFLAFLARRFNARNFSARDKLRIMEQHLYLFLLLGFIVLPTVAMLQFTALECIDLADGSSYLRVDTSVSCNSNSYKSFLYIDGVLIFLYQSVPLLWFVLLWRIRDKVNPQGADKYRVKSVKPGEKANRGRRVNVTSTATSSSGLAASVVAQGGLLSETEKSAVRGRNGDPSIQYLSFLWKDYMPARWYYEVFEMYRRIIFIAVIPLLGNEQSIRAIIGCMLSLVMIGFVREVSPFIRGATNILLGVAQYQIFLTFFAAFIIVTDGLAHLGLSTFALGALLFGINVFILALLAAWSVRRYMKEVKEKRWRKSLNNREFEIMNAVMAENKTMYFGKEEKKETIWEKGLHALKDAAHLPGHHHHKDKHGDIEMAAKDERHQAAKSRLGKFLDPNEIVMDEKIGAGAFGEVFKGTLHGEPCAIKTMIQVTQKTAQLFRAEIILTASLKHPNIVNFMGACVGRELTCLVLEWVAKGTLGDLLDGEDLHKLTWLDPMLKMSIEMAEGLTYLHSVEDPNTPTDVPKHCILHRDVKPENVLITEFMSCKISDFGTSRAKDLRADTTMSAVGTPLYCAPEIQRGEAYDETVDVYSFGLILLDLCIEDTLTQYIGARWAKDHDKKIPKQPMRFIRAMTEEGWRPLDHKAEYLPDDVPKSIIELIILCFDHDPTKRPKFAQVLEALKGPCYKEIRLNEEFTDFGKVFNPAKAGTKSSGAGKSVKAVSTLGKMMSRKESTKTKNVPSVGANELASGDGGTPI